MAWNEPGGSQDNDPWGGKRKQPGGPPDQCFAVEFGELLGGAEAT